MLEVRETSLPPTPPPPPPPSRSSHTRRSGNRGQYKFASKLPPRKTTGAAAPDAIEYDEEEEEEEEAEEVDAVTAEHDATATEDSEAVGPASSEESPLPKSGRCRSAGLPKSFWRPACAAGCDSDDAALPRHRLHS